MDDHSRFEIPSPVSLSKLVELYDSLIQELNQHHHQGDERPPPTTGILYRRLCIVCFLLLKADILTDEQTVVLDSTSRHALSLWRLLCDDDDNHDHGKHDELLPSIQIEYTKSDNTIHWKLEEGDSENLVLSKEELAAEEDMLRQMANTPIPTADDAMNPPL